MDGGGPICTSKGTVREGFLRSCPISDLNSLPYRTMEHVDFRVSNPSTETDTISWEIRAAPPDSDTTTSLLALDSLAVGQPVFGQLLLPPGATDSVGVQLHFIGDDPLRLYAVQFSASDPSSGTYDPVLESLALSDRPVVTSFVDCNGNGMADSLDIVNQTSQDLDGDGVPDECEGNCCGAPLSVTPVPQPIARFELAVVPNPTRPAAVQFVAEAGVGLRGVARLQVFDVAGRLVHTANVTVASGRASFSWDGVRSGGIYFARLELQGRVARTSFVVME